MNDLPTFDPRRSERVRSALVDAVETTAAARLSSRPHRWLGITVFAVAGIVTGGAVSGAAAVFNSPDAGPSAVAPAATSAAPAPPGAMPGAPIVSLLGEPVNTHVVGSTTIPLPAAPEGATHVRVTMACLSPGTTSWGLDPAGNNPTTTCSAGDLDGAANSSHLDFALDPGTSILTIHASKGAESIVTYQFVNHLPTALGVNERGETFGTSGFGAKPDLVAVIGRSSDGQMVEGYARAKDLDDFGPDWPGQPANPDEALAWQAERDARYPNGWDIPVWDSDGTTQIGTFHIGN